MPASLRTRRFGVLLVVLVTVTAAFAMNLATAPSASAITRQHRIAEGFTITRHQEGDWYKYGADGPNRFDCSGLVYYSFRRAGFQRVPRTAGGQARFMNRIRKGRLRKGDFVFFYSGSARAGNVYHVGVFSGWHNGHRTIIHAPHSGERVHRSKLWTSHWFAGTLRGR